MPDRSRIARKDSDLLTYLNSTSNYLKSPYIEPISQMVAVGETESIVRNEALPLYMMVTLENTGSPSDADLHFCMASTDTQACMAASSTMLSHGN